MKNAVSLLHTASLAGMFALAAGCAPSLSENGTDAGASTGGTGGDGGADAADGADGTTDGGEDGSADGATDGGADGSADSGADGADGADGGGQAPFFIYINEIMASNSSAVFEGGPEGVDPWTPDWVELYNPSTLDLPLDGYTISDDPDVPDLARLDGLVLPAGGRLLLYLDSDAAGPGRLPFSLSAAGERLSLYDPAGQALDQVEWTDMPSDFVAARVPDGGPLVLTNRATPDATNPESL